MPRDFTFTPENWYYCTAQEAQMWSDYNDKLRLRLIYECDNILEDEIRKDVYYPMSQAQKYSILMDKKRNLEYLSTEQLQKLINDHKKPEPYKHTTLFLIIYFKSLDLDPEWLSTMYITTLALEKEIQIKKDMAELEELKNSHKSKYGTLIEKINLFLK